MAKSLTQLMQEYFSCKQAIRTIKRQRSIFLSSHSCESEIDCIDDLRETGSLELCQVCEKRHEWHMEIYRLGHRCSGILTRVKKLVEGESRQKLNPKEPEEINVVNPIPEDYYDNLDKDRETLRKIQIDRWAHPTSAEPKGEQPEEAK